MTNERLDLARQLITALEMGDEAKVDELLDRVAGAREAQLFQEVGRLTRQLHDTLTSFTLDARIADMTAHDIPDAKERLNHVITMTEQAADQTLTAVETALPIAQALTEQATQLSAQWSRFLDREMPLDEFKTMTAEIAGHFQYATQGLDKIQSGLNDILMAQGFQDITGQIIRRVIALVHELETSMVDLVRISGRKFKPSDAQAISPELPGPVVPGVDDKAGDVAKSQDDVDDLLSSLGF